MDPYEVELADEELLAEVELTATLMVAGAQTDEPLSQAEIDHLLGLA